MPPPLIRFQPKQAHIDDLMYGPASWIGVGGGRGAAKSACIDRIALERSLAIPGSVRCVVMRNYDQVKKYHIDPILRDYPQLEDYYHKTDSKIVLPMGKDIPPSEIHFSYAEDLKNVERRFRSANYYDILVDQAEQFTEPELREMKQANRSRGAKQGACKMGLFFNMGGAGIQALRKWFHTKEYNPLERPDDFVFVHVFPWDNVEWVRAALDEDGVSDSEYYGWPEPRRMDYAATRGDYTRNLNSQDEALRARDWFGSWESLEGAYFGRVYDRDSTVISDEQVAVLMKPWAKKWLSQDWGKTHYCSSHWHCRTTITPDDANKVLGWNVTKPVKAVITYREYVDNEMGSADIGRQLVARTPEKERPQVERFFLSPDAFGERDSGNTIAEKQGAILRMDGMPAPEPADTDRATGWALMYNLLLETKRHAANDGEVWLISSLCPELTNALPLLMRDPKKLDDVLKTDQGMAKIEQDVADDVRYGLKSMLGTVPEPKEIQREAALAKIVNNTAKALADRKFEVNWAKAHVPIKRAPRWKH